MDPVSLALGIVPIILTSCKGFKKLTKKIHIFRHCSYEIHQVQRKLRIQGDSFRDELHLLLRQVLDDDEMAATIVDGKNHPQLQHNELEDRLKSYLGSKYTLFEATVNEIREIIEGLLEKFSTFTQSQTPHSLSKRTADAIQITLRKSNYTESLKTLKESNAELRRIRKVVWEIQKTPMRMDCISLPSGYETIRNMSSSLYNLLLNGSLSCSTVIDAHHCVRLLLNSTDEIHPSMNVFFEHRLIIQSHGGNIHFHGIPQQNCGRVMLPICASCKDDRHLVSTPEAGRVSQQPHNHRSVTIDMDHSADEGDNLTKTGVKCKELYVRSEACSGPSPRSLGYLNIRENKKLVLYPGLRGLDTSCDLLILRRTTPLVDFLSLPVHHVITDMDRIKLGITLVKSMLKYNSTPWWPQELTLSQVHVLGEEDNDLSSSLNTLHISIQLGAAGLATEGTKSPSISLDEEERRLSFLSPESIQYAMDNHGIRNLTLYGLGVSLLQIGLWENIPWEDHVQVRRKVARLSWLGKRYRDATKKLINCDFGLATEELCDRNLQSAIFRDVIGDLESIVNLLESSG
ncbi:uncharacterized protein GGS22DRAFT_63174 [Annulohypoxylon maeteangense]|uniref:uncharacterized protein n=1 Tax=Annulohypoxylon maeteangense TaxID=1927788 RepID=UPI0020080F80|nr:uncharacterized protein GGS22DRAFT_63174 [Annulohypoxylon maeteangense]KAI0888801.1 hypothetical protein GGS22DRAFT_63174 [Annulohypoxylon maeteangense]